CEVLVLHGVWDADTLAIWGEVAPRAGARSGAQKTSGVGNHPFSAGLDTLRRSMIEACSTEAADRAEPRELVLVLPGDTTAPAASTTAHTDPGGLPPWRVRALRLPAADAERLLARLDHVRAGPALMHLASVRAFAEHLVVSGCVLPDPVGNPPRARWRPAPLERAEEHLAALTAALPTAARAHLQGRGADVIARSCVLAPLELLTDAVARRSARPTRIEASAEDPSPTA